MKTEAQFKYFMSKDDNNTDDTSARDIIEEMERQEPSEDSKPSLNFDDVFQHSNTDTSNQ